VLKFGGKQKQAFKFSLIKKGYSEEVANAIWKWYTCPARKEPFAKKSKRNSSSCQTSS
jgi:hypothetical protein